MIPNIFTLALIVVYDDTWSLTLQEPALAFPNIQISALQSPRSTSTSGLPRLGLERTA